MVALIPVLLVLRRGRKELRVDLCVTVGLTAAMLGETCKDTEHQEVRAFVNEF